MLITTIDPHKKDRCRDSMEVVPTNGVDIVALVISVSPPLRKNRKQ